VTNMSTLGKQKLFEKADLTHSGFDLDPFFFLVSERWCLYHPLGLFPYKCTFNICFNSYIWKMWFQMSYSERGTELPCTVDVFV